MNINELNDIIENSDYPKKDFEAPSYCFSKDCFVIRSLLYNQYIYLNEISSLEELYQKIKEYNLDPELFNKPFYLMVALEDFNEKTIKVLNELDRSIPVLISAPRDIGLKEITYFFQIENDNVYLWNNNKIDQESMRYVLSKFKIDSNNSPMLILDKIDSGTPTFLRQCLKKYPNLRTRIEVKDFEAIKNLNNILPFIPEKEFFIFLDDNLFNDQNPNNIRPLLLEQNPSINLKIPETKKVTIIYNDQEYKNLEEVFSLEKYLEILKSHIPSEASTLDIVTYITLFIVNYFEYDYKKYENIKKNFNSNNWQDESIINLTEFMTRRKGVCGDYAIFTQHLLRQLNIECEVLSTDFVFFETHPEQLGHAFNLVRIDGYEYFLDITWLAESMRSGEIKSLADSPYFLSSNEDFGHDIYKSILDNYHCKTMDKELIRASIRRVASWKENYVIHKEALKDLFKKYLMKQEVPIEKQIENAILSRRYQK